VPLRPAEIVLPKIRGSEDVLIVSHYLTMAETLCDVPPGSIEINAMCTETRRSRLQSGWYTHSKGARVRFSWTARCWTSLTSRPLGGLSLRCNRTVLRDG
jgi:malate synthase